MVYLDIKHFNRESSGSENKETAKLIDNDRIKSKNFPAGIPVKISKFAAIQYDKPGKNSKYAAHSINDLSIRILGELKKITHKLDDINELENDVDHWRFAAKMLDRCCLYLFSAALIIVTVLFSMELIYDHLILNEYHH